MKYLLFILNLNVTVLFAQNNVNIIYTSSVADSLVQAGNLTAAIQLFPIQLNKDSNNVTSIYNYACALAKCRKIDTSFKLLFRYVEKEPIFFVLQDPDLINLHSDKRWLEITNKILNTPRKDPGKIKNIGLLIRLLNLFAKDQAYLNEISIAEERTGHNSSVVNAIWDLKEKYNQENRLELEKIVSEYGFPKISEVGKEGAKAAFLVVQHAALEFQKKYLNEIKNLCENKDAEWSSYAMLYDRIQLGENKSQLYGTQLVFNDEKQVYELYKIGGEEQLDERRRKMGLNSISDYVLPFGIIYNKAVSK